MNDCNKRINFVKEKFSYFSVFIACVIFLTAMNVAALVSINEEVTYLADITTEMITILIVGGIFISIAILIWLIWYFSAFFRTYTIVKKNKYKKMKDKIKEKTNKN